MPMGYTGRRLLQVLSAAGAAGIAGAPHVLTAAEVLETTTIRLAKRSLCNAPAPRSCCAPKASPRSALSIPGA
jgi:hypothetical protein